MNHHCNGDIFKAGGGFYYRCFADSSVRRCASFVWPPTALLSKCPACGRPVDAVVHDEQLEVKTLRYVEIDGGRVPLP